MKRWNNIATLVVAVSTIFATASAWAQAQREFPPHAQRGTMQVTTPPEILLNGHQERLSPGARIHSTQNMLVMSGALVGQAVLVNFTHDSDGLIREVWVLTPAETAQKPTQPAPRRMTPYDDGKTPFDQLPKFPNQ